MPNRVEISKLIIFPEEDGSQRCYRPLWQYQRCPCPIRYTTAPHGADSPPQWADGGSHR